MQYNQTKMCKDSLLNRISLIEKEIKSLKEVLAKSYFEAILRGGDIGVYEKNKLRLDALNQDMENARELIMNT